MKKYQVFVSSTYTDLIEERAAVTQCLLDMNCIPVGMEQFPASNMKQMDYIKMMLDDCDYYILILAGRYGSCDSDGIGFTEKEYDYALSQRIPVMSFLKDDIGVIPNDKCEKTEKGQKQLEEFRAKVSKDRIVRYYSDIGNLKADVAVSLSQCIRDFPRVGWVRAKEVTVDNVVSEVLATQQAQAQAQVQAQVHGHKTFRGVFSFAYSDNDGKFTIGSGNHTFVTHWSKASDKSIHAYRDGVEAIARVKGPTELQDELIGGFDFSSRVRTPNVGDIIIWRNKNGKYAATKIIDIKDDTRGSNRDELTCEYMIYG